MSDSKCITINKGQQFMAAFILPAGNSPSDDEIIDAYPKDQLYNSGEDQSALMKYNLASKSGMKGSGAVGLAVDIVNAYANNQESFHKVGEQIGRGAKALNSHLRNKNDRNKRTRLNGKRGSGDSGDGNGNNNNGGSGSNGNTRFNGGGGGGGSRSRGFQATQGVNSIVINSGIDAGLTVNPRLSNVNGSPLFMAAGYFFKTLDGKILALNSGNSQLRQYIQSVIYPLYEAIISNVNNRYAGTYINVNEFWAWFSYVTEALQLYYCIDDVLAYTSNNSRDNINPGMETLRSLITSNTIIEFNLMKETLENCVVPPMLLQFIRKMCQTHRVSDAPFSSLIKLNIGDMFGNDWDTNTPDPPLKLIQDVRLGLNTQSVTKINSFMFRAFPDWRIGNMPASTNQANYDVKFMTFWRNMPLAYIRGASYTDFTYTSPNNDITTEQYYDIHERDTQVDGLMYGIHTNIFKSVGTGAEVATGDYWGFWYPYATKTNKTANSDTRGYLSLLRYEPGLGIFGWCDEFTMAYSGIKNGVRFDTSTPYAATRERFGTYGWVNAQYTSVSMQNEAFNNAVRLLMDPPSIKVNRRR